MLIPSIDLQRGRIVQLVQGERLAIETSDFAGWIARFSRFSKVQVIDLDAAKREGDNSAVVADICSRLPCRVGGGIRTIERGAAVLAGGARKVIYGSSLFTDGKADLAFAAELAAAIPIEQLIAAVDARGGRVAINGWRTQLDMTPVQAVRALEPYFGEFLFTDADVEGLARTVRTISCRDFCISAMPATTLAGALGGTRISVPRSPAAIARVIASTSCGSPPNCRTMLRTIAAPSREPASTPRTIAAMAMVRIVA